MNEKSLFSFWSKGLDYTFPEIILTQHAHNKKGKLNVFTNYDILYSYIALMYIFSHVYV